MTIMHVHFDVFDKHAVVEMSILYSLLTYILNMCLDNIVTIALYLRYT